MSYRYFSAYSYITICIFGQIHPCFSSFKKLTISKETYGNNNDQLNYTTIEALTFKCYKIEILKLLNTMIKLIRVLALIWKFVYKYCVNIHMFELSKYCLCHITRLSVKLHYDRCYKYYIYCGVECSDYIPFKPILIHQSHLLYLSSKQQ